MDTTTPLREPSAPLAEILEGCLGCKWTLHVLGQIRGGVNRPGALERSADGLTAKVLAERLVKLVGFGILAKRAFAEVPPRVEYRFTPFGLRVAEVLEELERIRLEFAREERPESTSPVRKPGPARRSDRAGAAE